MRVEEEQQEKRSDQEFLEEFAATAARFEELHKELQERARAECSPALKRCADIVLTFQSAVNGTLKYAREALASLARQN